MKVIIDKIAKTEDEYISFHICEVTERVNQAIAYLSKVETHLIGKKDDEHYKVAYQAILYIETVDKKSFLYTTETIYSLSEKLYQLEEKLITADFVRISKSMILNIDKIISVYPTMSGRFEARLVNQECVAISRSYVSKLKAKIGLGKE